MLVYIAGSGAMGCTFGYYISKYTDNEVIFLDNWDKNIENLNNNGMKLTGKIEGSMDVRAMKPSEATEKADLIIFLTKSVGLEDMAKGVSHLVDKNTQILCLLNGIGHEDILVKYVDLSQINMGVTVWSAGRDNSGDINVTNIGTIDMQNIGGNEEEGRKIANILNEANLNVTYNEDVMKAIWRKLMVNGTLNSFSTLLECKVGEFFSLDSHAEIVDELISEFIEVAKADGVELDKKEMLDYIYKTSVHTKDHYPSMYQDLIINNRNTEIDFINGAVVEKGKRYNIKTPYNELITKLIHAKEELKGSKLF